ncbi:MAG: GTPase HflX [Chlamydiota bacterium]
MADQEKRLYEDVRYEISSLKTAFLIGCYDYKIGLELCREHINELEDLATTYGLRTLFKAPCPLRKIDPGTYLGKGKIGELATMAAKLKADVIVFDDEISPNQQRNLEQLFQRPIIDRTELILEIFSQHAQTKEAKLQIELAQSRYQLPRLKRLWTHLSRQTSGGKGFLKGAGERQIEIDRRLVRKRIHQLEQELLAVRNHRALQRQARMRAHLPSFSLIGYTNVGKSTLLRELTAADVLVEDKLFATLDTKSRKFTLPNTQEILLVDTVGFIRKLPHTLVAAFRSTLEEARYTDILLHLVDVNHPLAIEHAESTYHVLKELDIKDKPIITVLNKVDLLDNRAIITRFKLKYPCVIPLSAITKEGVPSLIEAMTTAISDLRTVLKLRVPQKDYAIVAELMERGQVLMRDYDEADVLIDVELPSYLAGRYAAFARSSD